MPTLSRPDDAHGLPLAALTAASDMQATERTAHVGGALRTVVVVPCFDEAARLDGEAFVAARGRHPELEFLFVDDGSRDGTGRVLERLAARDPAGVRVLSLDTNHGKAEAVRRGMQEAFASNPPIVGFLDADLATPIDELARMSGRLADPEVLVVLGSRVALLGRDIQRSARRHYAGRVFATVASLVLGLRVYDTQCGAKLFRGTPEVRGVFDRPFLSSWAFDVEVLARLLRLERDGSIPPVSRVVVEVPLRRWADVRGSKIGLLDSLTAAAQLLVIGWRYRR
jgi:glycosyltransferase involved in cell wall biosynthesis